MINVEPLVSIIIPVYKVEKYIRRCIESVQNQTYTNLEIILVDDGSPDNCGAICDEYAAKDTRIKVIHKENGGVSSARNAGLKRAQGDYIGWVDSDDSIEPDYIDKLIYSAVKSKAEIVVANKNIPSNRLISNDNILKAFLLDQLSRGMPYTLISMELFNNETFNNYSVGEDTEILMRLFEKAKNVYVIKSEGYNRLIREDSAIHCINPQNYQDWIDVYVFITRYLNSKHPELKPYCAYRMILEIGVIYNHIRTWPRSVKNTIIQRMRSLYIKSIFGIEIHFITLRKIKRIIFTGIKMIIG